MGLVYYSIGAPLFVTLFPVSIGLYCWGWNKLSIRVLTLLSITFMVTFLLWIPVITESVYVQHCNATDIHYESLSYFILRIGAHYWAFICNYYSNI